MSWSWLKKQMGICQFVFLCKIFFCNLKRDAPAWPHPFSYCNTLKDKLPNWSIHIWFLGHQLICSFLKWDFFKIMYSTCNLNIFWNARYPALVHQKWFQPIMGEIATKWQLIGIILLFFAYFLLVKTAERDIFEMLEVQNM